MDLSNKDVIHIKKNGVEYLQFKKLLEYSDIINHAYTLGIEKDYRTSTVDKKLLSQDKYEIAVDNYKKICEELHTNYINIAQPLQQHTKNVLTISEKMHTNKPDFGYGEYKNTDGLVTNKKNIILSTTNADCILLLLFDPVKKVIANVHSGWNGTLQRISVVGVNKMINEFNCNPEDIICCICPSIRKCHFEVDEDVKNMFESEFQDFENYDFPNNIENDMIKEIIDHQKEKKHLDNIIEYNKEKNKWHIDTVLINRVLLTKIGLKDENIIDCGICSVCNSNLIHSFRVEKDGYGLETALIELK
ncbi:MAG: polyphenol oxidase family protein [Clostridia bacterium]|nr:polyphenol oxidase family protein [Clostridia bacterium]